MVRTRRRQSSETAIARVNAGLLTLLVAIFALGWLTLRAEAARPLTSTDMVARVVLDANAAVSGDTILLGEIARVESDDPELKRHLEALTVGRAALPGEIRHVNVGTLRLRMRQARLPERRIAIEAEGETIAVSTKYQTLEADRLKAVVEEWYATTTALPEGAALHLKVDVAAEVAPVGTLAIDVALNAPRWGNAAVPLEIRLDDRPYKRINASVEALIEQPVWVTTRSFNRGETVGQGDVELVTRLFSQPVAGPVDWNVPVRTTRYVREGAALTWDLVEPIPDVMKGDQVMVIAQKGGVVVQVPGEAMSDGWVGDRLAVRNLGSGNVVYGSLSDDGTVLVQVW